MRITPRGELYGVFTAPSDRSVTQRAIILGSIAKGKTYVVRPLICSDTLATVNCARKIGAKVKIKDDIIEIKGVKTIRSGIKLDCGNSGSTMRLMCGVAAGSGINAVLIGGKYLSKRDMTAVKTPLEKMGATVALSEYSYAPVWVDGAPVRTIFYESDAVSSQVKSAVLLCALTGGVKATIKETRPTRDHTEILLKEMGANITEDKNGGTITLAKSELVGKKLYISGDPNSSAYLLYLGLTLGKVTVKNVYVNHTRTGLYTILRRMGADIEITNKRLLCGEVIGDVTAKKSKLYATHVTYEEALAIHDDIPLLAALMGLAEGESIIGGKSDACPERYGYVHEMINSLGGNCRKASGGLVIKGVERYSGGNVKVYGDHRVALSAAVALMSSENGGEIDDESCVNVSFPGFFDKLKKDNFAVLGKGYICDKAESVHGGILSVLSLNYCVFRYAAQIDGMKRAFSELKNYGGYAVYAPYCQEAYKHVQKFAGNAKAARSINCVAGVKGHSTDGEGVVAAVKLCGESFTGKSILVLGTGNAAKSIVYALFNEKARVSVYDVNYKAALEISKKYGDGVKAVADANEMKSGYDVIINATALGTGYYEGLSAASEELIKCCSLAVDISMEKNETQFIKYAKRNGVKYVDGERVMFCTTYYTDCVFAHRQPSEEELGMLYRANFGGSDR
ncbi:MAG: 3-phosphoshikimate 1-carboxyvinyltransferase [Clostridia bacterium]|nr:3-phosphoshikimate 1-carboxyvinyltransferase [Clostridia bacterium]